MSSSNLFAGLGPKIKSTFKAAVESKTVLFTESEVEECDDEVTGIPFELRFAPALQKKPTTEGPAQPKDFDPFAPPYQDGLFVMEDTIKEEDSSDSEDLVILLNKFCVAPRHFLMVTKEFEKQTTPVTPLQLVAAYSILKQLGSREKHLAFYNSGRESGASQPHKHVQFIPLSNGIAPFDSFIADHKPEDPKAPFQLPLPYANFTTMLSPPEENLTDYFAGVFLALIDLMIEHLRRLVIEDDGLSIRLSTLSYNIVMTEKYLHIVPRTKEKFALPNGGGQISVNALGFAGMLLVKRQEDLDALKKIGVLNVLKEVGYRPVAAGESVDELPADAPGTLNVTPTET